MKRIMYLCMAGLLGFAGLKAADLQTDEAYKPLKIALELAQPLATMQDTWNALATTHTLGQADLAEIASQALAYAREQKATREQELTALGNATHDSSLRTKGILYTAFGLWCVASLGRYIHCITSPIIKTTSGTVSSKYIGCYHRIDYLLFLLSSIISQLHMKNFSAISLLAGLTINLTAPYFLYKGYRTIRDAYAYKQMLLTQIEYLAAAIKFFEHQISPKVAV